MPSTKRKPKRTPRKSMPGSNEINLSLKPGTKTLLTIETGEEQAGEIPLRIRVQQAEGRGKSVRTSAQSGDGNGAKRLAGRVLQLAQKVREVSFFKKFDLAAWLFWGALFIYLSTRLIGLTKFPIYFFVDEALQTQFAAELVANHYRDHGGVLFPPAFRNGDYFTLGMGVYMQVLPYLLFGKSAVVTRATSAIISLIAAISVGLILRDAVKTKYWWVGVLFLSITPTWFLHSRTAWEMTEFTAFYAGALCAYTFYRIKSPNYLYPAILFGALGFYTYSPGQVLVPFTALAFIIFDWKYHWNNRRTILFGSLLLAMLAIPYARFRAMDPDNAVAHLHALGSYLFADISIWEKIQGYFSQYFYGLSPWFWYVPGDNTLQRHIMKGYGHIMIWTLPFAMLGLIETIRRVREPAYRILLTGWLAAPVATAFVEVGISRTMVYVFPTALLTAIGFDLALRWIESPSTRLAELLRESAPSRAGSLAGMNLLVFGLMTASLAKQNVDRIVISLLVVLLALRISGQCREFAHRISDSVLMEKIKRRHLPQPLIAWLVFVLFSAVNVFMLVDALRNSPTWYRDYGMGGMQYGAFQIFDVIKQYQQEHADTRVLFSPNWANGTDVVARFFLDDPLPVELHSIQGYVENKQPIGDDTVFIMTREEYEFAITSEKLADFRVEKTIPCPDATPCFYFVRLRYSDKADELFASEKALREIMQESIVKIDGEDVLIRHTYLEANDQSVGMQQVFDGNPYTHTKTYEANPFRMELTFPSPRTITGFSIITGSAKVSITLTGFVSPGSAPVTYTFEGQGALEQPMLSFDLPEPLTVQVLYLEQLDVYAIPPTKNHIWEITLR